MYCLFSDKNMIGVLFYSFFVGLLFPVVVP
jgi:hypothetical protein